MPKHYSAKFVERVRNSLDTDNLGYKLAIACFDRNISYAKVAKDLGVARMTVYRWFAGYDIRKNNREAVKIYLANLLDS